MELEEENLEGVQHKIVKAKDIMTELSLTREMGEGEIARNLSRLYEYMKYRLVEANCHKEARGIDEVLRLLHELLPAWEEAVKQSASGTQKVVVPTGSLQYA